MKHLPIIELPLPIDVFGGKIVLPLGLDPVEFRNLREGLIKLLDIYEDKITTRPSEGEATPDEGGRDDADQA